MIDQKYKISILTISLFLLFLFPLLLSTSNLIAGKTADEFAVKQLTTKHNQQEHNSHGELGRHLPLWSCIPFAGILLSIALIPMIKPEFWHHRFPLVSLFWGLSFSIPFLIIFQGEAIYQLLHIYLVDYIPFIILLWGLFTISGGIYIKGTFVGKPIVNLTFLIIGTLLASWMGTTGAAILLIRPLIRALRGRKYKIHTIIFFIFLVANIGGSLTPLGDPPLFLGFLHGVPFFWTFSILSHMLIVSGMLLVIYFILDTILYRKEGKIDDSKEETYEKFRIHGSHNFLLLLGIMGAVLMSGMWHAGEFQLFGVHMTYQSLLRDILIVMIGIISLKSTRKEYRDANDFTWFPIKEVAILFAGIFVTIIPPLLILQAGLEGSAAGLIKIVEKPIHYFWMTGSLSAFLDNAPTYLTFFNLTLGKLGLVEAQVTPILSGALVHEAGKQFVINLKAISAGAVFFGAVTYIGNAPNFMVRSIAEEARIKMPSFFGYMLWSVGILAPLFLIISLVFFN